MDNSNKPRVGLVSFTDDRLALFSHDRELEIQRQHNYLKKYLSDNSFLVIDPMLKLRGPKHADWFGIHLHSEVRFCSDFILKEKVDCLIVESHFWTPPMFVIELIRNTNVPVLIYAERYISSLTAVGAGLHQCVVNSHAITHERFQGKDFKKIPVWVKGVSAASKMKKISAMLWGGSYCLRMEHLQDDISKLKTIFIGDILNEDQSVILLKSFNILEKSPNRVDSFIAWINKNGAKITFDDKKLTNEILRKQLALVLAARDRLAELKEENIEGISIKCQHELSVDYGITACTIPAFLPFNEDSEGARDIIPTICEGDIKGLLSLMLLHKINPDIPPLFGDLMFIKNDYIRISNCGAASVFWACNSCDKNQILEGVNIKPTSHGKAGAAIGYFSKTGKVTVCRLTRVKDKYYMQLGIGESLPIEGTIKDEIMGTFGSEFPHMALKMDVKLENFVNVVGGNHPCITLGDCIDEVKYACREFGIPVIRIDSDEEINRYYNQVLRAD